jgi:hypothetical protein
MPRAISARISASRGVSPPGQPLARHAGQQRQVGACACAVRDLLFVPFPESGGCRGVTGWRWYRMKMPDPIRLVLGAADLAGQE